MTLRLGRGIAGWVFGLSVTVFLISMWGRAVVVDTDGLAEAMAPLSRSVPVVETVANWLRDEMVDAGVPPTAARESVAGVMEAPAVSEALSRLVVEVALAAGTSVPGAATVDVAAVLRPAVPEIIEVVVSATNGAVPPAVVAGVVEGLDPIVVVREGESPRIGPGSPIAGRLGVASVLALVVMGLSGSVVVAMADDRILEVRRLLSRLAMGALSFAIILRTGSWVLSPSGGRAPVASSLSMLAAGKWMVPLFIGLAAGAGALTVRQVRLRREAGSPPAAGQPTPTPEPLLSTPASH